MSGPMGEKCKDCYWFATTNEVEPNSGNCHHTSMIMVADMVIKDCAVIRNTWWCEHFADREERKRGIESIREISRRLEELREQGQVDLLDDLGIGKGKVN